MPPKPQQEATAPPAGANKWNLQSPAFNPAASLSVSAAAFAPSAASPATNLATASTSSALERRTSEYDEFDPTMPAPPNSTSQALLQEYALHQDLSNMHMNDQQHYDDQHEQYMNELAQQMEQEQAFYDQQQQEQEQHMSAEQLAAGDAMYASAGIMQPGLHPQLGVDESGYVAPHYSVFYYRPGPVDPPQHHLYAPSRAHLHHRQPPPNQWTWHDFFMDHKLREKLTRRSEAIHRVLDPNSDAAKQLPAELLAYHSLVPLQEDVSKSTKIFGYPSHIYKATSSLDGIAYALRRIAGYHLRDQRAMGVVEAWRSLRHPGVVALHEAFSTKAFGDESVVFVCDYFPRSRTLLAQHFVPSSPAADSSGDVTAATAAASNGTLRGRSQSKGASQRGGSTSTSQPPVTATIVPVTEAVLWSYIVQLVSAVKAIHDAGMACRILEPSKILITGKHRLRINCVGVFDLISYDGVDNTLHFQQDDLLSLGQLIICLACNSLASLQDIPTAMEFIGRSYPAASAADLQKVIMYLLSTPSPLKTINHVVGIIAGHTMQELTNAQNYNDSLEGELASELENGRLVRLLCKLGFINERPEFGVDPMWAETGDRYPLKLFRDYVFHQVDANGQPVLDLAHVIESLNKLDAGSLERVLLASRDEQSCIIASYQDIRRCLELAFAELQQKRK